jgi:hypothetical protein
MMMVPELKKQWVMDHLGLKTVIRVTGGEGKREETRERCGL